MLTKEATSQLHDCLIGLPLAILAASLVTISSGCNSGPSAIKPIAFNAKKASSAAMELYDKNGDGLLDDGELSKVPGILRYKEKYDEDQDGMVSREEITNRIKGWREQGVGFRTLEVVVLLDNRPLSGANVKFVPEAYLGAGPEVATGVTDEGGHAKISVASEHIPEDLRVARIRGLFAGTYRIEINHPSKQLRQDYREGLSIGDEVARDTIGDRIILKLSSK